MNTRIPATTWWRQLGLTDGLTYRASVNEHDAVRARTQYLSTLRPIFTASDAAEVHLTLNDVISQLAAIDAAHEEKRAQHQRVERERGWEGIRAARAAAHAEEPIDSGSWAGFTRADAIAWCWNLYQFESHGFGGVGAMVRKRDLARGRNRDLATLKGGGVPEDLGYAHRARELTLAGATPESYRTAKEAMGARVFDPRDVTH